jgi:DNA-directed RNA polymerase II subunit RPB4
MPRHRAQAEEEDAAALKLGSEFASAGCLLISEVKYLLEHKDRDNTDNALVLERMLFFSQPF